MVSVGGVRSRSSGSPNVLFLIDTFQPLNHGRGGDSLGDHEARLATLKLKRTVLRIMLMFHSREGQPIQWAFQFFDSTAPQEIGALNNRRFQEFSKAGVNCCADEYFQILSASRTPSTSFVPMARTLSGGGQAQSPASQPTPPPCVNIRTQLVHSLSDFAWTASSSFQSPIKPTGGVATASWKSHLHKNPPPVPIKNHIFLVSPLPHSWQDLESFGDAARASTKSASIMAGPRTNEFIEMLTNIKSVFFDQGPWERFVDQHLSLSWIDTRPEDSIQPPQTKTRVTTAMMIRTTFQLILNAFGGHIIPFHILHATLAPGDLYSFATIFAPYMATHIQPSIGFRLSRPAWTPLTLNEIEPIHPTAFIPPTAWRCDLLLPSKSQVCELDLAESGNDQDSEQAQDAFDITLLESVVAIKRVPLCLFNKALLAQGALKSVCGSQILCQTMCDAPDERFIQLIHSLYDKRDVLLLEMNVEIDQDKGSPAATSEEGPIRVVPAALVPTVRGSGIIQVLEKSVDIAQLLKMPVLSSETRHYSHTAPSSSGRVFSMGMLEPKLGSAGVFAEMALEKNIAHSSTVISYSFSKAPRDYWAAPCKGDKSNDASNDKKAEKNGEASDKDTDDPHTEIAAIESIDTLCLGVRKAYISHLYEYKYSVMDFTNKIIATSKEITSLASRQSVSIKEAMQALVNFIIQFLRISPAKLDSKYKQLGKELHIGKMTDSKTTTENYAILQDERPAIDSWKSRVMTSVQDDELRSDLKALKTKDTQIQIVQNLHIQMLIKKYELEEIRPMKRDPSVTKSILGFMDRLCIIASIDGTDKISARQRQLRLLRSPETPRSKDMDPAKRFFTRVIKRFYGASLPQLVKVLATKCGAELSSSLLTSPRPNRTAGMARSLSLGVLPRSDPLRSPSAKRVRDALKERINKSSNSNKDKTGMTMTKEGGKSLVSAKSSSNVLNNPIFRNRQVTMSRSSLKSSMVSATTSSGLMSRLQPKPSVDKTNGALTHDSKAEEEETVPQVAKLKLKKFYHDKESEEVLKLFRRKGPLSKADAQLTGLTGSGSLSTDDSDNRQSQDYHPTNPFNNDEDDDDINTLRGSTSWGVIKSTSTPRAHQHQAAMSTPSSSSLAVDFEHHSSEDLFAEIPASPSTSHIVPATPRSKRQIRSSLPMFHQGLDDLEEAERNEDEIVAPRTPTRREFLRRSLTDVNDQWLLHAHLASPSSGTIKVAGTPVGPGPSHVIGIGDGTGTPRTPTKSRYRQRRRESIQMGLSFAAQIRGSPVSAPMGSWPSSPSSRTATVPVGGDGTNSGWSSSLHKKWGSRLLGTQGSNKSDSGGEGSNSSRSLGAFSSQGVFGQEDAFDGAVVDDDEDEVVRSPMKRHLSRMLTIEDSPSSSSSSSTSFSATRKGLLFGRDGTQTAKRVRTKP